MVISTLLFYQQVYATTQVVSEQFLSGYSYPTNDEELNGMKPFTSSLNQNLIKG